MKFSSSAHIRVRKQWLQRAVHFYYSSGLLWIIISVGIILRIVQYLLPRSLYYDEAGIALNIVNRSLTELFKPLDFNQAAPIGFLLIEKIAVLKFGNNEYALRLFPLLCGIISLFLFYKVANHYLNPKAKPLALFLFALSNTLTYFSSETKQYGSDVAITLLLFTVIIYIHSKTLTAPRVFLFGIIGGMTIWVSHPSVFVLAGTGTTLALFHLYRKDWKDLYRLSIVYIIWALSLIVFYFISIRALSQNDYFIGYFRRSFMPFPPRSLADLMWFMNTFLTIFQNPGGMTATFSGIAALVFLVGCISLYSKNREKFFILISPALIALIASGFHLYPFFERLLLFIVPSLMLLIAEGTIEIINKAKQNLAIIGIGIAVFLLLHPLMATASLLRERTLDRAQNAEIRPIMGYIRENRKDGDALYVHNYAVYAFKYYSERYGFNEKDYISGVWSRHVLGDVAEDLDKLRGRRRVWIVFSHTYWTNFGEIRRFALYYLERIGKKIDSFKSDGADVYLYDLS